MSNNTTPIKSPCILVCSMDMQSGHCFGCGRTRDEIAGWINYSHDEREVIMAVLPERVAAIERKPRRITKRRQMVATQNTSTSRKTNF